MEQLKQHWCARALSLYLALSVALTSLFLTLALSQGRPVQAQQVSSAPFWAVLDFDNQTNYGGADVGREAGDALVLELGRSNRFNVITRSDVNQALNDLGLRPPLDSIDVQKLGRQLNANAVVSGSVLSISRSNNPAQVQAVVAVRVTDTQTGELINGALAEGSSAIHNGAVPDDDVLVNDAISKAAFAAVKQITSYNLPEPTVLNNQGPSTLLLNMGTRDGIQPGMRLLVSRNGIEVGRIQINTVTADDSTATVTQTTLGIRPGDHARAIYSLPNYSVHSGHVVTNGGSLATGSAVQATKSNAFSGVGGVVLAIAAAALIVGLVNRGSNNNSLGGGAIGGVTAQAAYGYAPGLHYSPSLVATAVSAGSYGVYISWSTGNLNQHLISAFNIYRTSFQPLSTQSSNTGSTTTTTTTTSGTTSGTLPFNFATGPVLTVNTNQTRSITDPNIARTITFPFISSTVSTTTGSTGGTTTSGSTTTTGSVGVQIGTVGVQSYGATPVPGPTLGLPTTYSVTAIYQVTSNFGGTTSGSTTSGSSTTTSGGTSGTTGYEETPVATGMSGTVTPILPIDITNSISNNSTVNAVLISGNAAYPATGVPLSNVVFSFVTNVGADTYVVDVSDRPNFSHKVVLSPNPITTISSGGIRVATNTINLKTLFPGVTTFYYRIGDRFSRDSPGPYRNDTINPNPDLFGSSQATYMYSTAYYFTGS